MNDSDAYQQMKRLHDRKEKSLTKLAQEVAELKSFLQRLGDSHRAAFAKANPQLPGTEIRKKQ